MAYNSSQQKLEELQTSALEACQGIEEGEAQAGSSRRVVSAPWAGTSLSACTAPFTWGSKKPLAWWFLTTGSTSRPSPRATSSPSVLMMRWR
jgi:hypothetical protein